MQIRACGLSDVGRARNHNEDCFDIDPRQQVFIVADGMGGHSHGEVASRIAVEAIREFIRQSADRDSTWPFVYDERLQRHSNRLQAAIRLAHDRVLRAIQQDGSLTGMGTTVVGFMLRDEVGAVAHVGDSRAYRLRDGTFELLTQDHTWVNEQVVAGYLSEEQAKTHPLKNVVTRALGGESEVVVDVQELEVAPRDRFLLCSDGLTTMLTDDEIQRTLGSERPLEEICRTLVQRANDRGGLDNITVVLLEVEEDAEDE
jgi:protein phosphatase